MAHTGILLGGAFFPDQTGEMALSGRVEGFVELSFIGIFCLQA
jgi:hypothetical protein